MILVKFESFCVCVWGGGGKSELFSEDNNNFTVFHLKSMHAPMSTLGVKLIIISSHFIINIDSSCG